MNNFRLIGNRLLQASLFLIFLVLPITRYNFYIESLGFSLNLFLVLFPLLLLVILISGYGPALLFVDKKKFLVLISLASVAIADFASYFYAYNPDVTLLGFIYRLIGYFFCWCVFSIIYSKKTSKSLIFPIWWGIVISSIVVSLIGIWQFNSYRKGVDLPLVAFEESINSRNLNLEGFTWFINEEEFLRPASTFFDPNNAAGFLGASGMIVFAMFLYLWVLNRSNRFREWSLLLKFVVVSFALFGSSILFLMQGSRSAIMGLVGSLSFVAVLLFFEKKYRRFVYIGIVSISILALCVAIFMPGLANAVLSKFVNIKDYNQTSDASRVIFAQGAIDAFESNFMNGVGVGNFEEYFINEVNSEYSLAHTHSAYLTFLSETGLVGFLANISWLILLVFFGVVELRRSFESFVSWRSLLLMGLVSVVVSVSLGNLFYGYYPASFWIWGYFGLLLGIIDD